MTADPGLRGLIGDALRFLRAFGLIAAAWTSLLAAVAPSVERPVMLWSGLAALWLWALVSLRVRAGTGWWAGWLAAGLLTQLLGPAAGTDGWSLAGGAPFVSLAGAALTGRRRAVAVTAAVLSVGALTRGVLDDQLPASLVTVLIFAFGGLALWWLVRIVREGEADRDRLRQQVVASEAARAVAMERNEAAARLHDSVLQTLTAVTRTDDLAEAHRLSSAAASELRTWLRHRHEIAGTFRETLERSCRDAAGDETIAVSVAGDRPLDQPALLLVAAAAEAVRNAIEHGAPPIHVYAETTADDTTVWIADSGSGFDLDAVPADRMGIRASIIGRLERAGGSARLTTGESGTEWALTLPSAVPPSVTGR